MTFRGNSERANSAKSWKPADIFCRLGNVDVRSAAVREGYGRGMLDLARVSAGKKARLPFQPVTHYTAFL
jgi:hypothetical protein